ncbi:MAG: carbohydrate ABC transporter permease [Eubacteriales bacterium]|nr:carbohydrate ABC transporter permease [Eubacteriales bacterium]
MAKKEKEKKVRDPFNPKREAKLIPGYVLLIIWVGFTILALLWILAASFSTSPEIMKGETMKFATGLHPENYAAAWTSNNIKVFFMNSAIYAVLGTVFTILISAPCAYVLARFTFLGNKVISSGFIVAMSIPQIMIVLPLFGLATKAHMTGTKLILILLYIGMQVPFTTTFLMTFFANLSRTYEEAAAIDGCSPMKTFWKIMLPLAQPGIVTVGIFNFMNIWNEYFISLIFGATEKNMSVGPGLKSVLTSMQYTGNWGGLFAAVIIVFLPTFIIYIVLSEKIIAGVTGGGIKG